MDNTGDGHVADAGGNVYLPDADTVTSLISAEMYNKLLCLRSQLVLIRQRVEEAAPYVFEAASAAVTDGLCDVAKRLALAVGVIASDSMAQVGHAVPTDTVCNNAGDDESKGSVTGNELNRDIRGTTRLAAMPADEYNAFVEQHNIDRQLIYDAHSNSITSRVTAELHHMITELYNDTVAYGERLAAMPYTFDHASEVLTECVRDDTSVLLRMAKRVSTHVAVLATENVDDCVGEN
jgi:hypothetical protein